MELEGMRVFVRTLVQSTLVEMTVVWRDSGGVMAGVQLALCYQCPHPIWPRLLSLTPLHTVTTVYQQNSPDIITLSKTHQSLSGGTKSHDFYIYIYIYKNVCVSS